MLLQSWCNIRIILHTDKVLLNVSILRQFRTSYITFCLFLSLFVGRHPILVCWMMVGWIGQMDDKRVNGWDELVGGM